MLSLPQNALALLLIALVFCGCSRVAPVEEIRSEPGTKNAVVEIEIDAQNDWPWWRGPQLDGHSLASNLVTSWGPNENLLWSVPVPGRGHSSPCIVGNHIFLTTADEAAEKQLIVCYERETGEQQWMTTAHEGNFMKLHRKNSQASATPASDGSSVFALFLNDGALWATATNMAGEILWQTKAGPFFSPSGKV